MDKVKMELKIPKNKIIEYNGVEFEVIPFMGMAEQAVLIEKYMSDYFDTSDIKTVKQTEFDYLNFDYLVNAVESIAMNKNLTPSTIGVYGDWGSGKSSLMYMCKKRLEQDDKKIKCLVFNGWLFESYDDAKSAILGSILDEISKQKGLSQKAKNVLKALYKSVDKFKLIKK